MPALPCLLYGSVYFDECSWLRLLEISINVNHDFYTHFTYIVYIYIIVYIYYCRVVCVFLLPFVMLVFVVILSKQVCLLHCFIFVAFVYNFIVERCKSKTNVLQTHRVFTQDRLNFTELLACFALPFIWQRNNLMNVHGFAFSKSL